MGSYKIYRCDNCKKQFELGGPQEYRKLIFFKSKVRHPGGFRKRVSGFWIYLWCPQCRRTEKKIMVEFKNAASSIEAWGRTATVKEKYLTEFPGQYNCSGCNEYLLDEIKENTQCNNCSKGAIEFVKMIQT